MNCPFRLSPQEYQDWLKAVEADRAIAEYRRSAGSNTANLPVDLPAAF